MFDENSPREDLQEGLALLAQLKNLIDAGGVVRCGHRTMEVPLLGILGG